MIGSNIKNTIRGWFFTSENIRSTLSSGGMLNPSMDLTNACNLNCPYCYIEEKNSVRKHRRPNELSLQESMKVIDEFADCGAKTINIVGAGEPTIDENFEEIITYIYNKGITAVLFTNGILLASKPEMVYFLYKHDVSVILKYNSISAEVQDLVAGKKGYTAKRNKALEILISAGFNNDAPTRLGIDIISFQGNLRDIPEIHRWCRENNVFPLAGDYIPTGRTDNGVFLGGKTVMNFNSDENKKAFELLEPVNKEERLWLINELNFIDKKFGIEREGCSAYFGGAICTQILGLYVDIEGNIWPCIARKKKVNAHLEPGFLGNIRLNDSPKKVWLENEYIQSLKDKFDGGCPYKPRLRQISKYVQVD